MVYYLDNAIIITKNLKKERNVMRKLMFLYILFFGACVNHPTLIEEKKIKRIALVIGNQNYNDNFLKNPINDARGIAKVLESIGFDVMLQLDVTLGELNRSLASLKKKIEVNNTMVFIYFAGHGNTLDKNSSEEFLLMTDKKEKTLVSIYKFYAFLREVRSRYNIICIDACRDYRQEYISKGTRNFRGNLQVRSIRHAKGIKKKEIAFFDNKYSYKLPRSTIISYAAMHHQIASDFSKYDDSHSSYTYALIKFLDDKEIPIEEVFRRVRVSQLQESNGSQSNLEETNLEKNIWLVPKQASVTFIPPI